MKTLIIVDIQNDFLPKGSLAVNNGDQIISVVNNLIEKFDLVVATQDWHPNNHKSFITEHPNHQVFDIIDLNGFQQTLWPPHCIQGTIGANFSKKLNTNKIAAIFRKGTDDTIDSYSGFYDNGKQKSTGLAGYLTEKNVKQVYICGLAADFCVYFTAKDALLLGLETYIINDATKAINPKNFEEIKKEFILSGGKITYSKDL